MLSNKAIPLNPKFSPGPFEETPVAIIKDGVLSPASMGFSSDNFTLKKIVYRQDTQGFVCSLAPKTADSAGQTLAGNAKDKTQATADGAAKPSEQPASAPKATDPKEKQNPNP
jgi:hypothetical protein